jgi:hypothetical protein
MLLLQRFTVVSYLFVFADEKLVNNNNELNIIVTVNVFCNQKCPKGSVDLDLMSAVIHCLALKKNSIL